MQAKEINSNASAATTAHKIDNSCLGWFRVLRVVDSQFQSWECLGWFESRSEAESFIRHNF